MKLFILVMILMVLSVLSFAQTPAMVLAFDKNVGAPPLTVNFLASCPTCVIEAWYFGDGSISLTPSLTQSHVYTSPGTFTAFVLGADSKGNPVSAIVPIIITLADNTYCGPGNVWLGGTHDGPAALPQACLNTALLATPSLGLKTIVPNTIAVGTNNTLMVMYNAANCGDTLIVPHGSNWSSPTGMQFANKNCDDLHWITITTDGVLPPEGVRIDPSYQPQMFTITVKGANDLSLGDHIRFIGVEFAQDPSVPLTDFFSTGGENANHVIWDRSYFHATGAAEARRAISLDDSQYMGIVDSYFTGFKCIARTGSCVDSQAIGGGNGTKTMGPWTIKNNFLEAGAENIIFGGGAATSTPCDIEIRRNNMYKPKSWNPSDASYANIPVIVKDLFELKNACRVLFEGNVLQNNWGGYSQVGYSIVVSPKNQAGANSISLCPTCSVNDLTIRYNSSQNTGAALQLANSRNDNGAWSAGGGNWSIHDNLFTGLQYLTCYGCGMGYNEILSGYAAASPPPSSEILHDVLAVHNTFVTAQNNSSKTLAFSFISGPPASNSSGTTQITNVSFQNSIFPSGPNGLYNAGGGTDSCATNHPKPIDILNSCYIGTSLWSGNTIVGYTKTQSDWPNGNSFVSNWASVGFINYGDGVTGDYHLSATSQVINSGNDKLNPGANIDFINQKTQGVVGVQQ